MKDYYSLLEIAPEASPDDVKKAFRTQIAKYHPDKVQHLGQEFQAMAADRATELTEAYRILSDAGRRAEYDKTRGTATAVEDPPAASAASSASTQPTAESPKAKAEPARDTGAKDKEKEKEKGGQFTSERASRDAFVRKATIDRFRQAFLQIAGSGYDDAQVRNFDFAVTPKSKLFGRGKGPALLGRFVSRVDGESVADTWTQAGKWTAPSGDGICIILMGTALASPRELAEAISEQRRKTRSSKITLIPVNSSVWDAHIPMDAPDVAKELLTRLRNTK